VRLINDTIARNRLGAGSGFGGHKDGYQVYNLAYSREPRSVTATITLANTLLAGANSLDHEHDLANQVFRVQPLNNQAIIADDSPHPPG
jgi:hypothetical protein